MIQTAICDDNTEFRALLKEVIKQTALPDLVDTDEYSSGEEFLRAAQNGKRYDIIFMDIQLKNLNGNETAIRYRQMDPNAILVFCSGTQLQVPPQMIRQASPFSYFVKESKAMSLQTEVSAALEEYKKRTKTEAPFIALNCTDFGERKFYLHDILYFTNEKRTVKRKVIIKCINENDKIYIEESLAELYEKLKDNDFEFCHKSFLVNLAHVKWVFKKEQHVTLDIESEPFISLSRARAEEFENHFVEYCGGKRK